MNNLFVAIPFVNETYMSSDLESVYLDIINESSYGFLKKIIKEFKIVKGENAQIWYDKTKLEAIFDDIMKNDFEKNYKPHIKELWTYFNDWNSIEAQYDTKTINSVDLKSGILCAYICNNNSNDAVVSDNIKKASNQSVPLVIIPCKHNEIYKWLSKHRDPKREWDKEYRKHGKLVKQGLRGTISSMSYNNSEYEEMLAWATGTTKSKCKYYIDKEKSRLVIFCEENTENKFHGYDVPENDKQENAKLLKRGKKELLEKIKIIAVIERRD